MTDACRVFGYTLSNIALLMNLYRWNLILSPKIEDNTISNEQIAETKKMKRKFLILFIILAAKFIIMGFVILCFMLITDNDFYLLTY